MTDTVYLSLRKFPRSLKARMAAWKPHYTKQLGFEHITQEDYFARLVGIGLEQVIPEGSELAVFMIPEGIGEWQGGVLAHEEVMNGVGL